MWNSCCGGNYSQNYGNKCCEKEQEKCYKKEIKCCEKIYDCDDMKSGMMKKQNSYWM
ncbi:MAG: hypothetical protein IJ809_00365 [Clostridia bacterium]|nr:hypothetical protein [Clostridia bacterium]